MMQIYLDESIDGATLLDLTPWISSASVETAQRGCTVLRLTLNYPRLMDQLQLYNRPALPHLRVTTHTGRLVWSGRLEEASIGGDVAQLTAYGYGRALTDVPYTALWSDDSVAGWGVVSETQFPGSSRPQRFDFDTNNRINISPRQNSNQGGGATAGMIGYVVPNGGSRQITGIQFSYTALFPVDWTMRLDRFSEAFGYLSSPWTLNSTGAGQAGAIHTTLTGCDRLIFQVFKNAAAVHPNDNGVNYLRVTSVRLVTSTANRVNTTLTVARTNGAGVTCTVGSTSGMYAGMDLVIGSGGANSEMVNVTAVTGGTTFTATVVNAPGGGYAIGTTVQGFKITANEIVSDLATQVNAVNSNQILSTVLASNPGLDITQALYEDADMTGILDALAVMGDTTQTRYAWRVDEVRRLIFERQRTSALNWRVTVNPGQLSINRALQPMGNRVYATYQETGGRTLRTAVANDTASQSRAGLVRIAPVAARTANAGVAQALRDAALADEATPAPAIALTVDQIEADAGGLASLWEPNAGRIDQITITNLPIGLPSDVADALRVFRLARTTLALKRGAPLTLKIEAEQPPATMEVLLAQDS